GAVPVLGFHPSLDRLLEDRDGVEGPRQPALDRLRRDGTPGAFDRVAFGVDFGRDFPDDVAVLVDLRVFLAGEDRARGLLEEGAGAKLTDDPVRGGDVVFVALDQFLGVGRV